VLKLAAKAGVRLWLSGHYHGNSTAVSRDNVEVVVSSSCGGVINWNKAAAEIATQRFPDFSKVVGEPQVIADANHSGLRVVHVQAEGIRHRWLTLGEVPQSMEDIFANQDSKGARSKAQENLAQLMGLAIPQKRRTMGDFSQLGRKGSVSTGTIPAHLRAPPSSADPAPPPATTSTTA